MAWLIITSKMKDNISKTRKPFFQEKAFTQ